MEDFKSSSSSRIWTGLVVLAIGVVFLLRNVGLAIPHWVISWPMLFIVIGLLIGYKRNWDGGGWIAMVLIGGFFMVSSITDYNFKKYYLAVSFMALGLWLIFKPKSEKKAKWKKRWEKKTADFTEVNKVEDIIDAQTNTGDQDSEVLDSVNVFGGSHQTVYSKNFKGGEVVAVFGGCDLNLTQSDFKDTIIIEVVAVFGGVKIIVPPGWELKSEVTAIFGGMDDKRGVAPMVIDGQRKVLIIRGVALFGGVDIRNF